MIEKQSRSRTEAGIPLYLLPQAITKKVREWGDAVYRISVKRTHWHHFNVTVRTKPVPRELKAQVAAVLSDTADEASVAKPAPGRRRRCPA